MNVLKNTIFLCGTLLCAICNGQNYSWHNLPEASDKAYQNCRQEIDADMQRRISSLQKLIDSPSVHPDAKNEFAKVLQDQKMRGPFNPGGILNKVRVANIRGPAELSKLAKEAADDKTEKGAALACVVQFYGVSTPGRAVSNGGSASSGSQYATVSDNGQVQGGSQRPSVNECKQKIIAIHQNMDREINAASGNDSAQEAARNRARQGQLDLFSGECSNHPEAANYVAQAREQLASSVGSTPQASLTRNSGNGRSTEPQNRGTSSKIIAGDGRSAVDCVRLVEMASADSKLGGGRRALVNNCGGPVEISWCYVATECARGSGNSWTLGAGRSWPIKHDEVRWGACHGANTISAEEGSAGLRYICKAPRN